MRRYLFVLVALGLGVATGEYLTTSFPFRHWLGKVVRRGDLQALVRREGIYESDVVRAWQADLFALGADPREIEKSVAQAQKHAALQRLMAQAKLDATAAAQSIDPGASRHEMDLLRRQFVDEKTWSAALRKSGTSLRGLEREVSSNLRGRAWLEGQITPQLQPNEAEARRYFDEHPAAFREPLRLRASHLFLAASDGYPEDVIEAKRALIVELSKRLANGESFPSLVAEFSEDEATKKRGGDLGYFAEHRILPAVFTAARQLHPGEISAPIRSRLGFHILRLIEARSAHPLTFEEARPEIQALLAGQKRAGSIAALVAALP